MARTKQITNHRTGKRAKTEFQHQTIPAPQPDPPAESPPAISFPTGPPCKRSALGNLGQAVLHFPPTSAFGPVFIDNQGVQHLDFPELDWGDNTDDDLDVSIYDRLSLPASVQKKLESRKRKRAPTEDHRFPFFTNIFPTCSLQTIG